MKGFRFVVTGALALSLVAGLTAGVTAQSGDGVAPSAVADINAHRVDGRHAIKYTSNTTARKGKLMAFGATGYLPNNIIQKATDADLIDGIDSTALATIAALRSPDGAVNEADNLVHWNQLFGVPAKVLAGDTTRSFIAQVSPVVGVNGTVAVAVAQPLGLDVETTIIPETDGAAFAIQPISPVIQGEFYVRNGGDLIQLLLVRNIGGVASAVKLRVTVWNDTFLSPAAAKQKIKVTYYKNIPKKYRP